MSLNTHNHWHDNFLNLLKITIPLFYLLFIVFTLTNFKVELKNLLSYFLLITGKSLYYERSGTKKSVFVLENFGDSKIHVFRWGVKIWKSKFIKIKRDDPLDF